MTTINPGDHIHHTSAGELPTTQTRRTCSGSPHGLRRFAPATPSPSTSKTTAEPRIEHYARTADGKYQHDNGDPVIEITRIVHPNTRSTQ